MNRAAGRIALVAHSGAGARAAAGERPARRAALLAALEAGATILRGGGSALDAVSAAVVALENDPWFNAGYGSVLNTDGEVEMDAALMVAAPVRGRATARAGAVAAVNRVRNPILLARAVMERTPHLLMVGAGAERIARQAGLALCRPDELVTERARERWRRMVEARVTTRAGAIDAGARGTVGAAAIDARGELAAATSTGGMTGKLPGRVGDSAVIGAGVFADARGAASATGEGEAIMKVSLCREAVLALGRVDAPAAAARAIAALGRETGAQAGIILVDRRGRIGFAHNAQSMQVATLDGGGSTRHLWVAPS